MKKSFLMISAALLLIAMVIALAKAEIVPLSMVVIGLWSIIAVVGFSATIRSEEYVRNFTSEQVQKELVTTLTGIGDSEHTRKQLLEQLKKERHLRMIAKLNRPLCIIMILTSPTPAIGLVYLAYRWNPADGTWTKIIIISSIILAVLHSARNMLKLKKDRAKGKALDELGVEALPVLEAFDKGSAGLPLPRGRLTSEVETSLSRQKKGDDGVAATSRAYAIRVARRISILKNPPSKKELLAAVSTIPEEPVYEFHTLVDPPYLRKEIEFLYRK